MIYFGVVEDRNDPLKIGRVRVRLFGLHTHIKQKISKNPLLAKIPLQIHTKISQKITFFHFFSIFFNFFGPKKWPFVMGFLKKHKNFTFFHFFFHFFIFFIFFCRNIIHFFGFFNFFHFFSLFLFLCLKTVILAIFQVWYN